MRYITATHSRHMSQVEVRLLIVQQFGKRVTLEDWCHSPVFTVNIKLRYGKEKEKKVDSMFHVIKNHNDLWRHHASAKICFCKWGKSITLRDRLRDTVYIYKYIYFFFFFFRFWSQRCKLFSLKLLSLLSFSLHAPLCLCFLSFSSSSVCFAEKGYTGLQGRAAMYSACLDDTHWKRQVCNLPLDPTQHKIHSCIICWLRGGKMRIVKCMCYSSTRVGVIQIGQNVSLHCYKEHFCTEESKLLCLFHRDLTSSHWDGKTSDACMNLLSLWFLCLFCFIWLFFAQKNCMGLFL